MNKYPIYLVEDHELVRRGIKNLLSMDEHYEIVGEFSSAENALHSLKKDRPSAVVMDISLPKMNGMEAAQKFREVLPDIKIIILSMHTDEEYILKCIDNEINGYVVKGSSANELLKALEFVRNGKIYYSEVVYSIALSFFRKKREPKKEDIKDKLMLTKRESEVLKLIVEGLTSYEISEKLSISNRTVEAHRSNILKKVGVKNTAELVRKTLSEKLI